MISFWPRFSVGGMVMRHRQSLAPAFLLGAVAVPTGKAGDEKVTRREIL